MKSSEGLSYWKWLFHGLKGEKPGIFLYWNKWLAFHIAISIIISIVTNEVKQSTAQTIVIPFVSILIAITVAWCGNIVVLLNNDEIIELTEKHKLGIEEYSYSVQNVILCLLITIISWTLYGIGLFNNFYGTTWLFFLSSLTIRECWHLIMFVQLLTIARTKIILARKTKKNDANK